MTIKRIDISDLKELYLSGAVILDTRNSQEFSDQFIKNSLSIADGIVPNGLKSMLELDQKIVLLHHLNHNIDLAIKKLEKYEFSNVSHCQYSDWIEVEQLNLSYDVIISITTEELVLEKKFGTPHVIDMRTLNEFEANHFKDAEHLSFNTLVSHNENIPAKDIYYLYDSDGYRSLSLISYLRRAGLHNLYHVFGGYKQLVIEGAELESSLDGTKPVNN
ncbi:MAG: rhodanese-like domain-containing protein [Bacteroidota bacterium]|nr:rhodanese-like domain-containing protein [Bacteroidota bacterium]